MVQNYSGSTGIECNSERTPRARPTVGNRFNDTEKLYFTFIDVLKYYTIIRHYIIKSNTIPYYAILYYTINRYYAIF